MQDLRSRYASLSNRTQKGIKFGSVILVFVVLALIIWGIVKITKKEGFRNRRLRRSYDFYCPNCCCRNCCGSKYDDSEYDDSEYDDSEYDDSEEFRFRRS